MQYGRLCGLCERIRGRDTASESERPSILKEAYRTAMALTEDRPSRIEIVDAGVMIRAGRVASPARIGRA